jgi:hypothetical protein
MLSRTILVHIPSCLIGISGLARPVQMHCRSRSGWICLSEPPGPSVVIGITQTRGLVMNSRSDRAAIARERLYDAETALHAARQSAVDAWIAAAYDRLHQAVCAHAAALSDATEAISL